VVNVPNAPNGGRVTIDSCDVNLLAQQYACITIDSLGACSSTTDCEVEFDWKYPDDDDANDDKEPDDDDAAFGLAVSPSLIAVLMAVAAAVGFRL
jgi:hypothetical protein